MNNKYITYLGIAIFVIFLGAFVLSQWKTESVNNNVTLWVEIWVGVIIALILFLESKTFRQQAIKIDNDRVKRTTDDTLYNIFLTHRSVRVSLNHLKKHPPDPLESEKEKPYLTGHGTLIKRKLSQIELFFQLLLINSDLNEKFVIVPVLLETIEEMKDDVEHCFRMGFQSKIDSLIGNSETMERQLMLTIRQRSELMLKMEYLFRN